MWHVADGESDIPANWPDRMRHTQMPAYKRGLLSALHAIVQACYLDRNRAGSGIESMEEFMVSFAAVATNQRRALQPYHLVATGYLAQYAPNEDRTTGYVRAWRNFLETRGNRIPSTVSETLMRLNCPPPASL